MNNQPTNQSNNSTLHSPSSQANSLSASHEIPHNLWKQKVQSHVYSSPPLLPILHHMNHPVHALPSHPISFRLPSGLCPSVYSSPPLLPSGLCPSVYPIRRGLRHSSMKCCPLVFFVCVCVSYHLR